MTRFSLETSAAAPRQWTSTRVGMWFALYFAVCFWAAFLIMPH